MSEQQRASAASQDQQTEDAVDPTPPGGASSPSAATSGVDDLLDDIDGVLEANAEEFVRGFVQKGGQ
ncbi:ubiquitin-like protein Pup [Tersicoccus sp. Bi-70]|uniref:ubiquitin-like protein Pup n=1 Tax=Tersicoccus sp. Bi-70 TaxID=1897634 RepID=UPI0009755A2D|nr:ubiquitin-like protein Pup [Tersicoccus sp. Bi-70]OMH33016.1 ubiquitin-like protein Pup [Tersicoccus sp. Bi-70]